MDEPRGTRGESLVFSPPSSLISAQKAAPSLTATVQNKANCRTDFLKAQMAGLEVRFSNYDYEKQSQFVPAQTSAKSLVEKDYGNKPRSGLRENKAKRQLLAGSSKR